MKKISILIFVFCFAFLWLLISPAKGEDYISKKFPSKEILAKNIGKDFHKLVGKHQNRDGDYEVFYIRRYRSGAFEGVEELERLKLLKLDTNAWIIQDVKILQK